MSDAIQLLFMAILGLITIGLGIIAAIGTFIVGILFIPVCAITDDPGMCQAAEGTMEVIGWLILLVGGGFLAFRFLGEGLMGLDFLHKWFNEEKAKGTPPIQLLPPDQSRTLYAQQMQEYQAYIKQAPPSIRALFSEVWHLMPQPLVADHSAAYLENDLETRKNFQSAMIASFDGFMSTLPKEAKGSPSSPLSAPVMEFFKDTHPLELLFRPFSQSIFLEHLTVRYEHNKLALQEYIKAKRIPKDDLRAHYNLLLKGTFFSRLVDARVTFAYNPESRFEGQWIVAPPKRGKTNLLQWQLLNDLKTDATIIAMDSKGDLVNPLRSLRLDREVITIDPSVEYPLALNPLDIEKKGDQLATFRSITLLEGLFASISEDAKMTAMQLTLFHSVLTLLIEAVPNPTIYTFSDILTSGYRKYQTYIDQLKDEDTRNFFSRDQFDNPEYRQTRTGVLWRLRHITNNPVIKAMFNSPRSKVDMGRLLDSGALILINADKGLLGEEGAQFYQRVFITLVLAAAQQRIADRRHRDVYFYIDECHSAIKNEPRMATIIQECRSKRVGMTLAHQAMQQIKSADVIGALADCAIRFANSDEEASQLAARMRTTPDLLRSLPVGSFAAFVRDATPRAVTINIPLMDLHKLPRLTSAEITNRDKLMRERYCTTASSDGTRPEWKKYAREEVRRIPYNDDPDDIDMSAR